MRHNRVATEPDLYLAGLANTVPIRWGPIRSLQFYNDFTYSHTRFNINIGYYFSIR